MVIDGKVAFTGGINMADEYINIKQRFGYWKDNGIRLRGQAVHNMTIMFLQMWNAFSQDKLTYDDYKTPETNLSSSGERGLVLPFSDDPLNREQIGEGMLLNMISTATRYIWFFTPYLIIDNELITAMILAAKRGVDVRIITPGIPDKKIVYLVTQSYYGQLVEEGVKIYQFRPGFIHSKCAVTDDRIATVGTMNLDFRSLYLHFENCVFLYENESVARIRDDMIRTMSQSSMVTPEQCHRTFIVRLLQSLLRIFSPML
jgi:cardiolipin synthase